jgi:hypothetical protein
MQFSGDVLVVEKMTNFNKGKLTPLPSRKEVGLKTENTLVSSMYQFHNRKSMFAVLHSDINSLKSGQPALVQKE